MLVGPMGTVLRIHALRRRCYHHQLALHNTDIYYMTKYFFYLIG